MVSVWVRQIFQHEMMFVPTLPLVMHFVEGFNVDDFSAGVQSLWSYDACNSLELNSNSQSIQPVRTLAAEIFICGVRLITRNISEVMEMNKMPSCPESCGTFFNIFMLMSRCCAKWPQDRQFVCIISCQRVTQGALQNVDTKLQQTNLSLI